MFGPLLRRVHVPLRRERITLADGDFVDLDWSDGDTLAGAPTLLVLHGLEGSSKSHYALGLLAGARARGWRGVVLNFRSCSGEMNRLPRLYHSGDTGDLDAIVRLLVARDPHARLGAVGVSLGGNVLLKWLGEHPGQSDVVAAATFSVPYDLGAGAHHLEDGILPRLYVTRFLLTLKQKTKWLMAHFPEMRGRLDLDAVMRAKTFREFDDAANGPIHGFRDADDYYTRSSSIHFLSAITTPTLCLSAADDPFLPAEVLERAKAVASDAVEFRITPFGGHTGFIAGTMPWRCQYWAEELIVHWLAGHTQ